MRTSLSDPQSFKQKRLCKKNNKCLVWQSFYSACSISGPIRKECVLLSGLRDGSGSAFEF